MHIRTAMAALSIAVLGVLGLAGAAHADHSSIETTGCENVHIICFLP